MRVWCDAEDARATIDDEGRTPEGPSPPGTAADAAVGGACVGRLCRHGGRAPPSNKRSSSACWHRCVSRSCTRVPCATFPMSRKLAVDGRHANCAVTSEPPPDCGTAQCAFRSDSGR